MDTNWWTKEPYNQRKERERIKKEADAQREIDAAKVHLNKALDEKAVALEHVIKAIIALLNPIEGNECDYEAVSGLTFVAKRIQDNLNAS